MTEMIMLVAYVRRARRVMVGQALRQLEQSGWSESEVVGHGYAAGGHGVDHVRFEVIVTAGRAEACTEAIARAADTGADGDGLVVSMPVLAATAVTARSAHH
jgi:nitrogen regulatory protein PII